MVGLLDISQRVYCCFFCTRANRESVPNAQESGASGNEFNIAKNENDINVFLKSFTLQF